jgi:hypothetical protein
MAFTTPLDIRVLRHIKDRAVGRNSEAYCAECWALPLRRTIRLSPIAPYAGSVIGAKGKVGDIVYLLHPAGNFIRAVKAANRRQQGLAKMR